MVLTIFNVFTTDYLQDQLNARNSEVNCLEEHVCSLQSELLSMQNQGEEVLRLREELNVSHSERLLLTKALENKDMELQNARLCIEKLEESISSAALDYQCEVESMKLDLLAMEQNCFDARKSQEEASQENARMNKLIQDLQSRIQNEEKVIECLDKENKILKEKLKKSEMNAKVFCEKVEKQLQGQLGEEHCTRELGEDSRYFYIYILLHHNQRCFYFLYFVDWSMHTHFSFLLVHIHHDKVTISVLTW